MSLRFAHLHRSATKRLRPGEKITEHGITAECLPDFDIRFEVSTMIDGQRVHRVIGRQSKGVTRTQCEEFLARAATDARAGRLSLPKGRKLALTVTNAAEQYIERLEAGTGKNIAIKKRHLRLYLKPFFGADRLDGLNTFALDRYKKRRLEDGAAAA